MIQTAPQDEEQTSRKKTIVCSIVDHLAAIQPPYGTMNRIGRLLYFHAVETHTINRNDYNEVFQRISEVLHPLHDRTWTRRKGGEYHHFNGDHGEHGGRKGVLFDSERDFNFDRDEDKARLKSDNPEFFE